jgi:hypothetical protein
MIKFKLMLRWAATFAGILGVIEIILWSAVVWAPDQSEMHPIWFLAVLIFIYVIPFLLALRVAWRLPLTGGILLITGALILPISTIILTLPGLIGESIMTILTSILFTVQVTMPISLPPFVTGILFVLSE